MVIEDPGSSAPYNKVLLNALENFQVVIMSVARLYPNRTNQNTLLMQW